MTDPEFVAPTQSSFLTPRGRDSALVDKILEKTKEGKITWTRLPNGWYAMLPSGLRIDITTRADVLFGTTWETFVITNSREKTEILRLGQVSNPILYAAGIVSPAHQRVSELVRYLEGTRDRLIQQVIDKLDQL